MAYPAWLPVQMQSKWDRSVKAGYSDDEIAAQARPVVLDKYHKSKAAGFTDAQIQEKTGIVIDSLIQPDLPKFGVEQMQQGPPVQIPLKHPEPDPRTVAQARPDPVPTEEVELQLAAGADPFGLEKPPPDPSAQPMFPQTDVISQAAIPDRPWEEVVSQSKVDIAMSRPGINLAGGLARFYEQGLRQIPLAGAMIEEMPEGWEHTPFIGVLEAAAFTAFQNISGAAAGKKIAAKTIASKPVRVFTDKAVKVMRKFGVKKGKAAKRAFAMAEDAQTFAGFEAIMSGIDAVQQDMTIPEASKEIFSRTMAGLFTGPLLGQVFRGVGAKFKKVKGKAEARVRETNRQRWEKMWDEDPEGMKAEVLQFLDDFQRAKTDIEGRQMAISPEQMEAGRLLAFEKPGVKSREYPDPTKLSDTQLSNAYQEATRLFGSIEESRLGGELRGKIKQQIAEIEGEMAKRGLAPPPDVGPTARATGLTAEQIRAGMEVAKKRAKPKEPKVLEFEKPEAPEPLKKRTRKEKVKDIKREQELAEEAQTSAVDYAQGQINIAAETFPFDREVLTPYWKGKLSKGKWGFDQVTTHYNEIHGTKYTPEQYWDKVLEGIEVIRQRNLKKGRRGEKISQIEERHKALEEWEKLPDDQKEANMTDEIYQALMEQEYGRDWREYGSGAASARSYASRAEYARTGPEPGERSARLPLQMPELVELAQMINEGKIPNVKKLLRVFAGRAQGVFKPSKRDIDVAAFIFKNPEEAQKTMAHEIGHMADFFPEGSMKRGNILGRIASLKKYMKSYLEAYPGAKGPLTAAEKEALKVRAKQLLKKGEKWIDEVIERESPVSADDVLKIWRTGENQGTWDPKLYDYIARLTTAQKKEILHAALKGNMPEWVPKKKTKVKTGKKIKEEVEPKAKEILEKYKDLINEEIRKRQLIEKDVVVDELKELTQIWAPFDPARNPKYTKYRHSSSELYADALSVLLNEPKLLEDTAPTFTRGFFAFLDRKPEFKAAYQELQTMLRSGQEAVLEHRHQRFIDMIMKGQEKRTEMMKDNDRIHPFEVLAQFHELLVERHGRAFRKVKKIRKEFRKGKRETFYDPQKDPQYLTEELPYITSEVNPYMNMVAKTRDKMGFMNFETDPKLQKRNLSDAYYDAYLFLRRTTTERVDMANPLGQGGPQAGPEGLDFLRTKIGKKNYDKIVQLEKDYWQHRKENVLKPIAEAKMWDKETMKRLNDNENYATFNVQDFMEKKYGVGMGGQLYKQIGTLKMIESPFVARVAKDVSLIRAKNVNNTARAWVEMLQKNHPEGITPAKTAWNGRFMAPQKPKDPALGMIQYLDEGKINAFYVDKNIARIFENKPESFRLLTRILQWTAYPFKEMFVIKRPDWAAHNFMRDTLRLWKNNPGMNPWPVIRALGRNAKEAYLEAFKGIQGPKIRKMMKEKMIPTHRSWKAFDLPPETELERMIIKAGIDQPRYRRQILRPFRALLRYAENPGQFSERIVKLAGYDLAVQRGLAPAEVGHFVRNLAGSPDFYAGGAGKKILNSTYLFSNAQIKGWEGDIEAIAQNPAQYAIKSAITAVAPTLLKWTAYVGGLGWGYKEVMEKISEHDRSTYNTIPIGLTPDNKAVYFIVPFDFAGGFLSKAIWKGLKSRRDEDVTQMTKFLAGEIPFMKLSPHLQMGIDLLHYSTGTNPQDSWRGKPAINAKVFEAGGMRSHKEFLKYQWNNFGLGAFYRFRSSDLEKVQGELEKTLNIPVVGTVLKRFVRVSDYGTVEEMKKVARDMGKKESKEDLEIRDIIIERINKIEKPTVKNMFDDMGDLYGQLVDEGRIDPKTWTIRKFRETYWRFSMYRFDNDPYAKAISIARTKRQKEAIIGQMYANQINKLREEGKPIAAKKLEEAAQEDGYIMRRLRARVYYVTEEGKAEKEREGR